MLPAPAASTQARQCVYIYYLKMNDATEARFLRYWRKKVQFRSRSSSIFLRCLFLTPFSMDARLGLRYCTHERRNSVALLTNPIHRFLTNYHYQTKRLLIPKLSSPVSPITSNLYALNVHASISESRYSS